ncbi:MAG: glycosyltransferase family 2 protein [Balneolaceae bacterium]|nr:glycosyltransferase family 2 protein [Balneolaceae bacterium]MCH8547933.1 glycosyltransferase family 2 protein [Balneolaceae bacterium]
MQEKKSEHITNIQTARPEISVVVPLLNEEKSIRELSIALGKALSDYSFEMIFVDDGSTDSSWEIIEELSESNYNIKGIRLRRNYGKSDALQAGFEEVRGQYVVTMDADLQDDPAEIPAMVVMLKEGSELVSGWKKVRHDPISKTVPSRFFNAVTRWTTGIHLHDFNCGLKAYRREVIENIYLYGELHRYVPLLAKWKGFSQITEKEVKHHPRKYGRTKFGISRFLHGFLDLVTLLFVNRYMQRPMHFFGTIGVLLLIVGGLISGWLAYLKIFFGEPLGNRPLLFLGILLIVVGVQSFSIGFLGEMLNRGQVRNNKPAIAKKIGL